ncbi:MAG: hypothetical protein EPO01_11085 [Aquabacterium sp.]|nr:MAG: hypothetical protein EPO01_11085 [Aquabacterium sp.]
MLPPPRPSDASTPAPVAERERRRAARARRAVIWGRGILMGSATVALVLAMRHVAQIPQQQQRLAPAAVLVIVYLVTAWITLSGQLDDWFTGKRR